MVKQNTKKNIALITMPFIICFLMIWNFFWSDNNRLRINPFIFWPIVAAISLVTIFSQKVKINTYVKISLLSFLWCIFSSLFTPSWDVGVSFILEILLYFIAVRLFTKKNIDYVNIAYGFCVVHMLLLLMQVFLPSIFYSIVGLISSPAKIVLLQKNASNGIFYGFTGQTSTIAFYLLFGLAISLFKLTKGKGYNYLFLIMSILFEVSLLLTNRRGGTLVSLIIILVFIVLDKRRVAIKAVVLLLLLGLFLFIGLDRIPGLAGIINKFQITSERNNILSGRTLFWDYCINIFKSHPVFGDGFGSFAQNTQFEVETAHNSYLQELSELGIIGSIIFFAPHFYTFFLSLKIYFSKKVSLGIKKYILFAILMQLMFLIFAVFEGVYETPVLYVFIFLVEYAVVDKYLCFKEKGALYEYSYSYCR